MRFVELPSIGPAIPEGLHGAITEPIRFRVAGNPQVFHGYEATVLADLCEAILDARRRGILHDQQKKIAQRAEVLLGAFARVGIVALVDEATGYQAERAKDELRKILEAYIAPELLPWTQRFPPEFYAQMFRLRGWKFTPGNSPKPMMAGKLTAQLVYERLPPGVLEELREVNPVQENGRRRHKHHQFLTNTIGHPHLDRHVSSVTTLMRVSKTWRQFKRFFEEAFPVPGTQTVLAIDPEDYEGDSAGAA